MESAREHESRSCGNAAARGAVADRRVRVSASGFTLLELIVALGLIAIGAALVSPAFLFPPAQQDEAIDRVADARRLALRRAESVTLPIGDEMQIRISPLGACALE